MNQVVWNRTCAIQNVFHETPKRSMEQSIKAGYMIKLDKTFEFHETKFHRVVWALAFNT